MPRCRDAPLPMTLLFPHRHSLPQRVTVFADWLEDLLREYVLA
ncbi:MAG: hypothetical protein QM682_14265 [Paracoccus sp. (in: a-proteobacteria)]